MAQDVACYLPNCLAASICRRTASSELHAAGAYRHGERQEVQRQGGHGRRLAFNLHVNGSPHLAGETYHAFAFRRCMHARLIHRSTELIDESGDISKSGLPEALKFWVIIGTQNHLPDTSTMAVSDGKVFTIVFIFLIFLR